MLTPASSPPPLPGVPAAPDSSPATTVVVAALTSTVPVPSVPAAAGARAAPLSAPMAPSPFVPSVPTSANCLLTPSAVSATVIFLPSLVSLAPSSIGLMVMPADAAIPIDDGVAVGAVSGTVNYKPLNIKSIKILSSNFYNNLRNVVK